VVTVVLLPVEKKRRRRIVALDGPIIALLMIVNDELGRNLKELVMACV
jgi:hypothetical protein